MLVNDFIHWPSGNDKVIEIEMNADASGLWPTTGNFL